MFGYEPNEVLGKPILDVFSQTLKPPLQEAAQDLPSYATPLRKKDGTLIYVETLSRLQNYRGQVVQVMAFRNVTDRVYAERDLRRQRALLDEILNGVQEGVAIVDEQQRIAFCNPAFAELLDEQPEQLLGQSLLDYVDEWARHILQHQLTLGKSGQVARREVPLLTAKGKRKVLQVTTSQRLTPEGEHKGVFMAATDITERVRTEQALDRSERLYRALFEHANDAILLLNLEGVYIAANPKAAEIFGCPMSEVIGRSIKDFTTPEEYEGAWQVHNAVLDGAMMPPYECNLLRKDGSRLSVEVNVSLVRDPSGKPLYIQNIIRDISERQQRERRIRLQVQRLKAIRDIDRAITSSLDLRQTIDVLLAQTVTQLNVDAADILLYNPQEQTLEVAFRRGFHTGALRHTHLKLGEGYAGRAALEQRIVYIPNLAETPGDLSRATLLAMEGFSTYYAVPLIAKGQLKGVLEIFRRKPLQPDPEWEEFLESLASQAAIAIDNAELFRDLQRSNEELMQAYEFTLEGWAKALELRDRETEGHCQRVTEMTLRLGRMMGMSEEELVDLRRGALLHDIGKMGIPDSILLKRGPLSEAEWEIMRQHPTYAYQMLSATSYLRRALDIPYCHHEKWDGSGYPRGLKGEEIPLAARIFAVVDAWDALNTNRPYRQARSKEAALEEIRTQAGKHFDPKVVETFIRLIQEEG
jgi:PAS domain S-box-containing protein